MLNNLCSTIPVHSTKVQSRIVQSGHDPPYGVPSLVSARAGYLPSDLHPRRALVREKRTRKSGVDVWRAGRCSMRSGEVQLRLALPFSEPFLPSIRLFELLILCTTGFNHLKAGILPSHSSSKSPRVSWGKSRFLCQYSKQID
jgi:hypothetical protein